MITIKEGDVDIGANPSAEGGEDEALEDGAQTVNNVVYSFRLQVRQCAHFFNGIAYHTRCWWDTIEVKWLIIIF